jgi:hypothetical protein
VKDWASPALLGRQIRPLPEDPRHDRAFIVVPDHRMSRRPGYLDIVAKNMRKTAAAKVTVMSERQFTAAVRDALAEHGGQGADHESEDDHA